MKNLQKLWQMEYEQKGIPSSFRETPTRIVKLFVEKYNGSGNALDIGCGKGRNSIFLAQNGYSVYAIDFLPSATREVKQKAKTLNLNIQTICQSVTEPFPFPDNYFDLIIDIFCYKHQVNGKDRKKYRKEVERVLKPTGFFVLSLAGKNDSFYGRLLKQNSNIITDTFTKIQSVLFTKADIEKEFSCFRIVEFIPTSDESEMHGRMYKRETLNFVMKKFSR